MSIGCSGSTTEEKSLGVSGEELRSTEFFRIENKVQFSDERKKLPESSTTHHTFRATWAGLGCS